MKTNHISGDVKKDEWNFRGAQTRIEKAQKGKGKEEDKRGGSVQQVKEDRK